MPGKSPTGCWTCKPNIGFGLLVLISGLLLRFQGLHQPLMPLASISNISRQQTNQGRMFASFKIAGQTQT